jgi:flagellar M-ring protein FliF
VERIALTSILDLLNRLGPARLAAMGAVTMALIGFFAFVILRVSTPTMGVLYSDLPVEDAGAILRDLDTRNVRYELNDDGRTVLVPKADVAKLRMDFASRGIPSGGSIGYEIFDKGDAFSSTSFVQNVNHLRALEGELSRTIRSLTKVRSARVHLVIPERRLFERDREPPRASIALRVSGELDQGQVRAVRHLVASAVEGLKPERVSIVDERGRLLADGASGEIEASVGSDERQTAYERRLRGEVEEIVASVVGQGRTRVQVSAEMDQNRIQQTSESFDPDSRVVRSTQTRNENQATVESGAGQIGVGNELPNAQQNNQQTNQREQSQKSEETVNYEISKTTRTEVVEGGRVKRLSVAVLVDGNYQKSGGGEPAYQPRSQEELDRIAALVRSAIGFDAKRGDTVEVVNLRFAEQPQVDMGQEAGLMASLFTPTKEDVMRGIELLVLFLLTVMVLLVVVRPLVKSILATPKMQARMAAITGVPTAGAGVGPGGEDLPIPDSTTERMIEFAKNNGELQARSLERIGQLVGDNPNATVSVLRQWIHEQS